MKLSSFARFAFIARRNLALVNREPSVRKGMLRLQRSHLFSSATNNQDTSDEDTSFDIYSRSSESLLKGKDISYKASFSGGDSESRQYFSSKRYIMPISIGQKVHEDGRIRATLMLVNKNFFDGVILIDDIIQRHTLKIMFPELTDDALYEMAKREGDIWLEKYSPYIKKTLDGKVEIVRWEYFLRHPEFSKCEENVTRLLIDSSEYRESFDRNINEFIGRLFKREKALDYDFAYNQCKKYLVEECAVMQLWLTLGVHVEVYPSGRNHAMEATNKLLIKAKTHGIEHVGIRFKKQNNEYPPDTLFALDC